MIKKFNDLTHILIKHQRIWQKLVFKETNSNHLDDFPELINWLMTITDLEVLKLQSSDEELLTAIQPFFNDANKIATLIQFPLKTKRSPDAPSKFWDNGISGRKAQQILDFSQAIGPIEQPILEWCSGKQHLSRYLSSINNQPALGLEIDEHLVASANLLSAKHRQAKPVKTCQCDVLSPDAIQYLSESQHAVALHACGGLHTQLLKASTSKQLDRISISPCCYHRFNASNKYEPLSTLAQKSSLELTMEDLRLATRVTKTASVSETQKRRKLQEWRLGFDCLQKTIRGTDTYLDTPSIHSSILKTDFKQCCLHISEIKGISLSKTAIDFDFFEAKGARRFKLYERLELARMIFRRALETWLVLDRALFLSEKGYRANVSIFCSSDISPRNFLIDASVC